MDKMNKKIAFDIEKTRKLNIERIRSINIKKVTTEYLLKKGVKLWILRNNGILEYGASLILWRDKQWEQYIKKNFIRKINTH